MEDFGNQLIEQKHGKEFLELLERIDLRLTVLQTELGEEYSDINIKTFFVWHDLNGNIKMGVDPICKNKILMTQIENIIKEENNK